MKWCHCEGEGIIGAGNLADGASKSFAEGFCIGTMTMGSCMGVMRTAAG